MKRVISIILLLVIIVSAIHPIIAMHYCGDELLSYSIIQSEVIPESCCDEAEELQMHDNFGQKCCDTRLLELSTDEYQSSTNQIISRIILPITDLAVFINSSLMNKPEPETNTHLSVLKFPPKGLFLKDVNILTYICIYRI